MKRVILFLMAYASAGVLLSAESAQQSFVKAWEGRTVTVKATLYSLIFNERGKLGGSKDGLREGLMVVTPSQGTYLQFDGRQGRYEVVHRDPGRMVAEVNANYEPDSLDMRPYRKVEALAVNQFDPGVTLVVRDVRIDRDQVKLDLAMELRGETVTALRVKWPVPLSKDFTERTLVEGLIQQYVAVRQPQPITASR
jgi:hypothetical protein